MLGKELSKTGTTGETLAGKANTKELTFISSPFPLPTCPPDTPPPNLELTSKGALELTEAGVGTSREDFIYSVARADDNDLGHVRRERKGLCPGVVELPGWTDTERYTMTNTCSRMSVRYEKGMNPLTSLGGVACGSLSEK